MIFVTEIGLEQWNDERSNYSMFKQIDDEAAI